MGGSSPPILGHTRSPHPLHCQVTIAVRMAIFDNQSPRKKRGIGWPGTFTKFEYQHLE